MTDSILYNDLRWPELQALADKGAMILLPIGQTEEHGPHLPVGCDYHISSETAIAVAEKASSELPVLTLPTLWCGYSGKDLFNWPGVISMPPEVVISVIENICLSLGRSGFKKVVTMNSHGHHVGIARVAARKVADQSEVCVVVTDIWRMANDVVSRVRESESGRCCHAGEYETSLLLHFRREWTCKQHKTSRLYRTANFSPVIISELLLRYFGLPGDIRKAGQELMALLRLHPQKKER